MSGSIEAVQDRAEAPGELESGAADARLAGQSSSLALAALAVAAFGIGTTEYVIMGLLPEMASELSVTISEAGVLISAYALGVTIGGPLLTIATTTLPRKLTLVALMAIFVLGNLGCALAPNYEWLMAARIMTALCHAAFFGIGSVVATGLVAPERRAQAIGMMFGGLTLANVLGVPAGTFLGQWAGWRSTFAAVTVIGLFALVAVVKWVPRLRVRHAAGIIGELGILRDSQIWLTLAMSVLSSTSMFTLFTYIAPVLRDVTGIAPHHVGGVLLICGVGLTAGNLIGARLGDWKMMPSLIGSLGAVIVTLGLISLFSSRPLPTVILLCLWSAAVFGATTILQSRVVHLAGEGANLVSTLNIGAFNFGNAVGAWIGGLVIDAGRPLSEIPWVAAWVAILTTVLAGVAYWLDKVRSPLPDRSPVAFLVCR